MSVSRIAAISIALGVATVGARAQCKPVTSAELSPAGGAPGDIFGYDVSLQGDLALVGASHDAEHGTQTGAAYLYARDQGGAGNWGEVVKLTAADPQEYHGFGLAVAVHGATAVVGAGCDGEQGTCAGAAYVFERDHGGAGHWGQAQKLLASDGTGGRFFGNAVELDGDLAFVAAPFWDGPQGSNSGAVYVFRREASGWVEADRLHPFDPVNNGWFGYALAFDGDGLAVGAPGAGFGAVYVCRRDAQTGGWYEEQKLLPSTYYNGMGYGRTVALYGDTLVAGADTESLVGFDSGALYVFERDPQNAAWSETAKLVSSELQAHDWLGSSVALEGDVLLAGAPGRDGPFNAQHTGAAYVFERSPTAPLGWIETRRLRPVTPVAEDSFGYSMSLDGRTVLVGAPSQILQPLGTGEAFVSDDVSPPPPAAYCTAGVSANGCVPSFATVGRARRSYPDGFLVSSVGLDGAPNAILFWGTTPQTKPWSATSWLCIVPPVVRTPVQTTTGTPGACDGVFAMDFNAWMQAHPLRAPAAGTNVRAQVWYREQGGSGVTSSLTGGLSFGVCP